MNRSVAPSRLRWYLERLRVMSAREVAHRVAEQGRRSLYRRRPPVPPQLVRDEAARPVLLPQLMSLGLLPGVVEYWKQRSAALHGGHITLLGQTWPSDPVPDWRRDPVSGKSWPLGYAFDIDYRHAAHELGEAKYVWELNRLLYLLPVIAHAVSSNDVNCVRLAASHVDSWIEENPPYRGMGWSSGIETALRLVSLVAVDEAVTAVAPDPGFSGRVHESVLAHVAWIQRFPSRYSSANNHRIAELGGLIVAASRSDVAAETLGFPSLLRELETVSRALFAADGVGLEQSSTYAAFTLEWIAIAAVAAEVAGAAVPSGLTGVMRSAATALATFTDCAGNVVLYGDDDEGRVVSAAVPHEQFFQAVGELLPARARAGEPPCGLVVLEQGGYAVSRSMEHGREALWVFDHGPLGFGEIAAHGHADALSVWLHYDGRPLFIDAGTYLYHSGDEWREYLRSTESHNTVALGGVSSSTTAGNFNWRRDHRAQARLIGYDGSSRWSVEAEHDGYVEDQGVRHRRVLQRLDEGRFRITDWVLGGSATGRWSLQLAPDLDVADVSNGWLVRRGEDRLATIRWTGDAAPSRFRGSDQPRAGWHSPRFGELVEATQLVLECELSDTRALIVDITLHDNSA